MACRLDAAYRAKSVLSTTAVFGLGLKNKFPMSSSLPEVRSVDRMTDHSSKSVNLYAVHIPK